MASSSQMFSAGQGAATAPPAGDGRSGDTWHAEPPPQRTTTQDYNLLPNEKDADMAHPGRGIPVYGPLALPATTYPYTYQQDARTLSVEYRDSSRLAVFCSRPTHRVLVMVWDELFWILSLPLLFCSTLLLSAFRFTLEAAVRPVLLGPIQLLGDHVLKPLSVVHYDALLLPLITLSANVTTALLLVVRPLGEVLDVLVRPLARLLSSIRLVHISYEAPPALPKMDGAQHV